MSEYIDQATHERLLVMMQETHLIGTSRELSFSRRFWRASTEYARYVFGFMALAFLLMSLDSSISDKTLLHVFAVINIVIFYALELYRIVQNHLLKRILEKLATRVASDSAPGESFSSR